MYLKIWPPNYLLLWQIENWVEKRLKSINWLLLWISLHMAIGSAANPTIQNQQKTHMHACLESFWWKDNSKARILRSKQTSAEPQGAHTIHLCSRDPYVPATNLNRSLSNVVQSETGGDGLWLARKDIASTHYSRSSTVAFWFSSRASSGPFGWIFDWKVREELWIFWPLCCEVWKRSDTILAGKIAPALEPFQNKDPTLVLLL